MTISYRHGLSVLELLVYIPSVFVAVFLVARHGLRTNSGFLFLAIFTLTRIVGACCDLATISNPSIGLYTAAAICSSIGLSPLMLACSGLLSRANLSVEQTTGRKALPDIIFRAFRLLTVAALVLSIVGITSDMSVQGFEHPDIKVKIGMILFIVCWAVLVAILALLSLRLDSIERGEKRTLLAVALSAPFILVRLLYALFMWFLHNADFNMLNGNVTVQLVMSVLEEIVVVVVCLAIGMTLRVRRRDPVPASGEEEPMTSYRSRKP
ncbi:Uncharacterized protein PECH_006532 [Penicillium ucsense]|uniref:DUF7702 domain-containing protein n=1 Tax=Penicillium ucsense TaxID=2839758 RepID=A0A8J8WID4_9EURO|nr:Uncharacterized protein PECM_006052 [Penicillium ucsense]KAF7735530.1 Uncharacterized protein PECH_006532 [Penicillium ucsense]